ncbi:glycosyltransferase [Xylanimonas sp. McL0601]|uniref:glycosyltransferase n=1 Tax=Xylanimonas sp. McL0601 TaxID=3414739 RepID=UPI003CEE2853
MPLSSRRAPGSEPASDTVPETSAEATADALETAEFEQALVAALAVDAPADAEPVLVGEPAAALGEALLGREQWSAPSWAADRPFKVPGGDAEGAEGPAAAAAAARPSAASTTSADLALVAALRRGLPLDEAVVSVVRTAPKTANADLRALCHSLADQPETRTAGVVGSAVIALRAGIRDLAWELLASVDPADAGRLAPAEYLRSGIAARAVESLRNASAWVRDGVVADAPTLLELAKLFLVADEPAAAREATRAARVALVGAPDAEGLRESLDYLGPWIEKSLAILSGDRRAPEVPAGHVSFAVIDYKAPDEKVSSSNIGDNVQTIAALTHLLRHQGVRLHAAGEQAGHADPEGAELTEAIRELQARVRLEHALAGPAGGADVDLTVVQRDVTRLDVVPENTWMLAFGWYMHNQFDLRFDFPFHPNLQPIFVSFHINKHAILTPAAVEYLKAHGPIGCRDWTTVHLLLNAGVPAFFSGCLTTTIDTVFPAGFTPAGAGAPSAFVDAPVPDGADGDYITQQYPEVRGRSAATNMREAVRLLDSYRTHYGTVVTSRLHCFLPSWSIGANVDFRPKNDADIRFAGILDATEADRRAMQERIRRVVAAAMGQILAGASREEVYAAWREAVAPEVELARHVHAEPVASPSTPGGVTVDITAQVARVRATRVVVEAVAPRTADAGAQVEVAVALDGNLRSQMEVVVGGVVRNTARPVRVHALTREHSPADHARLAALFPEVTFEWYACDDVDYGSVLGMLKHITVATMDRLLLPELLDHVVRVIYHDLDALTVTDLGELFDLDLAGAPLAARPSISYNYRHGIGNVIRSTRLLSHDPAAARDLIRVTTQRHQWGYHSFNAGILLLDLAVMRADGFTEEFVPYAERYGLNDQDVLNQYAGSRYVAMDARWNVWPTQELVCDPALIHWAGPVKPWDQHRYIHQSHHWQAAEAWLATRR